MNLANQHKLEIPGVSTAEITAQRTRAARLRPLQQSVEELAGKLGTAVFAAQSQSWAATTDLYTALKWMSRRNANLRRELAPVTAFFANGKRKPKPTPPATPPAK
ncbi:MAG TPA: hypothetical protein VFF06_14920 [Polyangia bacterium]|nr:hypothetical protein [Polyangia bacterium]